jgi:hypothetical protein
MPCVEKGPKTAADCGPCSSSTRNRYFRGKLLTVADYRAEQGYLIQRRRMVNRTVLGWGVIAGFPVTTNAEGGVAVGQGVAFDRRGRELVACEGVVLAAAGDVLWLQRRTDGCITAGAKPAAGRYRLDAHYAECLIDGVRIDDGCGQASCEWNHVCETVVYALWPDGGRQRPDCMPPRYPTGECKQPDGSEWVPVPDEQAKAAEVDDRGPHGTLCRWSRDWRDREDLDPCKLTPLDKSGRLSVDFGAGVALAYVEVAQDKCGDFVLTSVDEECSPRRLVRTNDLLFDLIRGCDLTRIQDIGWRCWHELPVPTVSFRNFREMFVPPLRLARAPADSTEGDDEPETEYPPVDTRFWVCFSAPVQIASLTRDVMTMTLIRREPDEDLGNVLRIPIVDLVAEATAPSDPPGTTRCMRPRVSYQFWRGELTDDASGFERRPILVEIEIRGDLILDWAAQAVDGNAIGRRLPTGNGTPGGDFVSAFSVRRGGERIPPYPAAAVSAA